MYPLEWLVLFAFEVTLKYLISLHEILDAIMLVNVDRL